MATEQQILGALRRHAIVSVSVERANAMGLPVPREAVMELQRIEADINSVLPPSAAGAVARFQDQVKSDLLRMEGDGYGQAMYEQRSEALAKIATQRDRGAKNVTASIHDGNGRTGLTLKQLQDALATASSRRMPPLHAKEAYRAEVFVESGNAIDPGKFMQEWTKAFDAPPDSPTRNKFLDAIGADKMRPRRPCTVLQCSSRPTCLRPRCRRDAMIVRSKPIRTPSSRECTRSAHQDASGST